VFPDNVVVAGLTYRFMLAKGFDVGPWGQRYMQARDIAMAQDGGARTLNMGRKRWPILLSGANIPDTGIWPVMPIQVVSYLSPTGGWNSFNARDNMPETDAVILDNFFPGDVLLSACATATPRTATRALARTMSAR
jgi:hypothetical protein